MATDLFMVYSTIDSMESAKKLVNKLIDQRIIACANIVNNITSIYRWQGERCEDNECIIITKCTKDQCPEIMDKINELHPYDCPCVVSIAINDVLPDYLKWLVNETNEGK